MFDPVSLITGGIGLIGSLFGGDDKKTTETSESTSTSSIDYKAMADAATAAGFNPLTAIRTGGASGFVTTNTKSKGESTTSGSGPNWGGIADAVGTIAGGLNLGMNNAADPIGAKSGKKGRAVSTALVDSQLRGAAKRPAGALYSAGQTIGTKVSSNAASSKYAAKSSPVKSKFFGPHDPAQWAKDNKIDDLYKPFYDRFTNSIVYAANPDGPDGDQLPVPAIVKASNKLPSSTPFIDAYGNRLQSAWERVSSRPLFTVGPASQEKIDKAKASWHRGWLPSISFD